MANGPSFRRLLLGLHSGTADPAAFRIAADLARALGLEMSAILVEDAALAVASHLPIARELRLPTHEWLAANPERVARELQLALDNVRRHVARESAAAGIECRLQIAHGDPSTALFALSSREDIVVVLDPAESMDFITGINKRMHEAAMASEATILLVPSHPRMSSGPILVAADGSDRRAISVAGRLAVTSNRCLLVLATDNGRQDPGSLRDAALASGLPSGSIEVAPIRSLRRQDLLDTPGARSGYCLVGTRSLFDVGADTSLSSALGIPVLMLGPRRASAD